MELKAGNKIDKRYRLVRKLGSGGFSEVWLAEKNQVNQLNVALKIYYSGSTTGEERERFIRKFEMVFNLRHTNLLPYYDCNEENGMLYFVMPWCERGSIASQAGRLTETEAWRFLSDVASGLAYLHQKNIIHQDIKPDNVLLSNDDTYLIADFDISVKTRNTRRMGEEAPAGTAAYMAPERFGSQPAPIQASDIWALGASLYELLTGSFPFGDNGGLVQKSGVPIPTVNRRITRHLQHLITLCLQPEPWNRPTAQEIVAFCNEFTETGKVRFGPKYREILGLSRKGKFHASPTDMLHIAGFVFVCAGVGIGTHYSISQINKEIAERIEIQKPNVAEEERSRQETIHMQINRLISDANAAFTRENPDYNEAFRLYMEAKNLGSTDTEGYARFFGKARELLAILGECDEIVRDFLQKAQQLNDTEEVKNELNKCP
jgi:serine/threonine protein kinase